MADHVIGTGIVEVLPELKDFAKDLLKGIQQPLNDAGKAASTQISSSMTKAQSSVGGFGTVAKATFVAIGVAAAAGLGKAISTTQTLAGETRLLARQLGLSAEDASRLRFASEELGVSTDSLSRGAGVLAKNFATGASALNKYGVEVVRSQDGSVDFIATLGNISTKYNELPAGIDRAAFAQQVFGKSGRDLVPILAAGADKLAAMGDQAERLGLVFSQKDLDASKKLAAAQRELGAAVDGLFVSLGKGVIPTLTTLVGVGTEVIAFLNRLPGPVRTGIVLITGLGTAGAIAGLAFNKISSGLQAFTPLLGLLGRGNAEAAQGTEELAQASEGAHESLLLQAGASVEAAHGVGVLATKSVAARGSVGGVGIAARGAAAGALEALAGVSSLVVGFAALATVGIVVIARLQSVRREQARFAEEVQAIAREILSTPGAYAKMLDDINTQQRAFAAGQARESAAVADAQRAYGLAGDALRDFQEQQKLSEDTSAAAVEKSLELSRAWDAARRGFELARRPVEDLFREIQAGVAPMNESVASTVRASIANHELFDAMRVLVGWQNTAGFGWKTYNAITKDSTRFTEIQLAVIGQAVSRLDVLGGGLTRTERQQARAAATAGDFAREEDILRGALKRVGGDFDATAERVRAVADAHRLAALQALAQQGAELALAGGLLGVQGALLGASSSQGRLKDAQSAVTKTQKDLNKAIADHGENSKAAKAASAAYKDAVDDLRQAQLDSVSAQLGIEQAVQSYGETLAGPVLKAQSDVVKAQEGFNKAVAEHGPASKEAQAAQESLNTATDVYDRAIKDLGPNQRDAIAKIREMGEKAGLTKGEINKLIERVKAHIAGLKLIPPKVSTTVGVKDDATGPLNRILGLMRQLQSGGASISVSARLARAEEGLAEGAVFKAQSGFLFRAGEGSGATPAGEGGEIVSNSGVFPLSDRVLDRVGDRVSSHGDAALIAELRALRADVQALAGWPREQPARPVARPAGSAVLADTLVIKQDGHEVAKAERRRRILTGVVGG